MRDQRRRARSGRYRVAAATVAAAACAAALAPVAAQAAPTPTPPGGSRLTFGVQAAQRSAPDLRPHYAYTVAQGGQIIDYLAISNYSTQQIALRIYPGDAFTNQDGGFDLTRSGQQPKDIGRWVTVKTSSVVLAARTRTILPFRLHVPADATPGDHVGGVVVSLTARERNPRGDVVTVEHRLAERIYLRVPGAVHPGLAVTTLAAKYAGSSNPLGRGAVTITYRLTNNGNVALGALATASLGNPFGRVTARPVVVPEILPGSSIERTVTLQHILPALIASAKVSAGTVLTARDRGLAPATASDSRLVWTIPWVLLGLLAAAVVAVALQRRRARRRPAPAHAARRSGPAGRRRMPAGRGAEAG